MIAVCDVNTIWRHRPFAAMAEITDVLATTPCDWFAARRSSVTHSISKSDMLHVDLLLPPGWASKTAFLGQRMMWKKIVSAAKRHSKSIDCVVITSPHYLTLLSFIPKNIKTVYYASDDYRNYEGWNNMAALEKRVVQQVDHTFFISEALAARARKEYDVAPDKISVSMNGTEERFFPSADATLPVEPPKGSLKRPIAGVVGGIGDRLDFELLHTCADLPDMGTLLLVGPIPDERSEPLERLIQHPKCVSVGAQPHDKMHLWYKSLDVGLIPYVESEFNAFCSPMRLFDHLASSRSIVATKACDQVQAFSSVINVCADQQEFVSTVAQIITDVNEDNTFSQRREIARQQSWNCRARNVLDIIDGL